MKHLDRCVCGGFWVGGQCSQCGAECKCTRCRRKRAESTKPKQALLSFCQILAGPEVTLRVKRRFPPSERALIESVLDTTCTVILNLDQPDPMAGTSKKT